MMFPHVCMRSTACCRNSLLYLCPSFAPLCGSFLAKCASQLCLILGVHSKRACLHGVRKSTLGRSSFAARMTQRPKRDGLEQERHLILSVRVRLETRAFGKQMNFEHCNWERSSPNFNGLRGQNLQGLLNSAK